MKVPEPSVPDGSEVHVKVRALFWRRITVGTVVVLVVLLSSLQAYSLALVRRNVAQVESCTTPGRACYERAQDETASAVATINEVTLYAATCADKLDRQTLVEIQACVMRKIAANQP